MFNRSLVQASAEFSTFFHASKDANYHRALLDGTFNRQNFIRPWTYEGNMLSGFEDTSAAYTTGTHHECSIHHRYSP
jgi:hypothetical protein